jgi:hypothetical protein
MKAHVDVIEPAFGPGPGSQHHACPCQLCRRERRFYRIAAKLPPDDEAWLLGFYDYVTDDLEPALNKIYAVKRKPGHNT